MLFEALELSEKVGVEIFQLFKCVFLDQDHQILFGYCVS